MANLTRREMLATGAAAAACPASAFAFHPDPAKDIGAWAPVANLPFPVQEIYPAPFWKQPAQRVLKPKPYNIIVNAGGIIGGDPFEITDQVNYYDPVENVWRAGPSIPAPRHHFMLTNNNGFLYGLGGFTSDEDGAWRMRGDCWRLDSINGEWSRRASLPHPQAEAICLSLGGVVHLIGGRAPAGSRNQYWSDHIDTDEHWVYDAVGDRWLKAAPMLTPRNSAAGVVFRNSIYVFGGRTVSDGNLATVEVYDPLSDRWASARPMPKAQGGLAAAVLYNRIYVFGGEFFDNGRGVFANCWEYSPQTDRWRAVAAMIRPRHGLGAVTLDNAIYAIGGALQAGVRQTSAAVDRFTISPE